MSAITEPDVGAQQGAAQTISQSVSQAVPEAASLDGRSVFVPARAGDDRPGAGAMFLYTESADLVHATYSGGRVRLGYRVGTRHGNYVQFRWAEVLVTGESRGGQADARLEVLPDGRVRLHEIWSADGLTRGSRRAEGIGVADEVPAAEPAAEPAA